MMLATFISKNYQKKTMSSNGNAAHRNLVSKISSCTQISKCRDVFSRDGVLNSEILNDSGNIFLVIEDDSFAYFIKLLNKQLSMRNLFFHGIA